MLWLVLVLLLALWSVGDELYRDVPGPRRLPVLGSVFAFAGCNPEHLWELSAGLFAQYGGRFAVRLLGQHTLHVRDPADVRALLAHPRNIAKGTLYQYMRPLLGSGLIVSTGHLWHTRRKLLTPAFRLAALQQHLAAFCAGGRSLADELSHRARLAAPVDLLPLVAERTLHTLFCTVMGAEPSAQVPGMRQYRDAVVDMCRLAHDRLAGVWLDSDLLYYLTPAGKRFRRSVDVARRFVDDYIERRRGEERGGGGSVLALLLAAERRGELDEAGVSDEIHNIMFAGHESTALAIAHGLMLLAEHQDVQDRLYEECAGATTAEALARLPLLEAVVREVLRLYPSAPVIARHVDEDFHMNGVVVRCGTQVVAHLYHLQRHPAHFPAPAAFRPERPPPPHAYACVPFSAGPRNCIGQRFARLEIKCYLAEVVRRLRLAAAAPWPALRPDLVLRPAGPLSVRLLPR